MRFRKEKPKSGYAVQWDRYVTQSYPQNWRGKEGIEWPGDEWGTEKFWNLIFETLFVPYGVDAWTSAVEIGSGSGKYTKRVLDTALGATVHAFDISQEFLKVCGERLAPEVDAGRLILTELKGSRADEMLTSLEERGVGRKLDALYSIDAMVHVDLQFLIAYLTTAGLTLRPGGHLIMSLADATRDLGFEHLMNGLAQFYHLQGKPCGKFEYLSPELVTNVLGRLGFSIQYMGSLHPAGIEGRDIHVVARLDEPENAERWRASVTADPAL